MPPDRLDIETGNVDVPAINAVGLALGFGAKPVLNDVNLAFPTRVRAHKMVPRKEFRKVAARIADRTAFSRGQLTA